MNNYDKLKIMNDAKTGARAVYTESKARFILARLVDGAVTYDAYQTKGEITAAMQECQGAPGLDFIPYEISRKRGITEVFTLNRKGDLLDKRETIDVKVMEEAP